MVSAASMTPTASPRIDNSPHTGARLVSTDGLALPLQAAELEVDAKGGLARTVLTQTFVNPGSSPLHVQYLLPLPADGAVSGFSFKIADELVAGEVQTKQVAQERYTQALIEGRTAALVQQSRTSLFRQSVGNIPPHETVVAKIVVDQPLRWLEEAGAWQWRFPTVVAPRYQGAAGRVKDAAELAVDVSAEPLTVRMGLQLKIRDSISEGARPSSSSHSLHVKTEGATLVRLADEGGARLDRDVVVHWPVAAPQPGASLDVVRPAAAAHGGDAFGLLTLVPPALSAGWGAVARDLVVLIDTSGSMGGEPLNQAKRVISALIDTLGEQDRLELISFDYSPTRFRKAPISASPEAKREAQDWLQALSAGGGTEMHAAVQEALRPLRQGAQRQVVLVTDGYIGFEREIVHKVRTALPASCRLHTVGVGSSVNRSLTQAAARAGAGVEIIIAPTEDPERAAQRLVARTDRPVVTELVIEGQGLQGHAPVHLPDLFAGTPAQVSLRLSGAGGQVRLRGRTPDGELVQSIAYPGMALGQGAGQIAVRYARERVFDLEAHKVGGGDAQEIDAQIEQLGLDFQIATDLTSWVAVSEKVRVDPAETAQTVNQPHEAPQHVSLAGVGLRPPALSLASSSGGAPAMERAVASGFGGVARSRKAKKGRGMAPPPPAPKPASISEFVDEEDFDDDVSLAEEAEDGFSVEGAWQEVSADKAEVDREEMAKELVADPLPLKRAAAAKPAPRAQPQQASAAMPEPSEAGLDEAALADEADLEDAGDAAQAASLPSQPGAAKPDDRPESLQTAPSAPLKVRARRGKLWALLVVLAAILGALWWFLRPHAAGEASSTEAPASSAPQSESTPPEAR